MSDAAREPRQWFSPEMERMGATYAAWTLEQTEVFNEYQPMADWHVDVEASTFRQGAVTVRMAPLGTFGTDGSWVWAWANPHMHPPGSERLAASLELRRIGEQHGITELVTPRLELSEFAEPAMAAERLYVAVTGVLAGRGYGSVTADTGAKFAMVMIDEAIPRAEFDFVTLPRRIMQAIEVFPHDHRATVGGYLERHGFTVAEPFPGALHGARPDCGVNATFDEHGRLSNVSIDNSTGQSAGARG